MSKVSEQLLEQLEKPDADEMLDVVIELRSPDTPQTKAAQSRAEKIAAMKQNFLQDVEPVEEAVRSVGGELTGQAWINRTVRARVPTVGVRKLSEQDQIAKVDVPHALERDAIT
jgi:hypothetical protein